MENEKVTTDHTKDKDVDGMPAIELIEYEKISYISEMQEYLAKLKGMPRAEAQRVSKETLIKCQIIEEDGEFTEHYRVSFSVEKKMR